MMEVINYIGLNMSGSWATWLFSVAAKTTTLLLAAWLVSRALTAYAPRVRYLVWSSAILCALALPLASALVPNWHLLSPAPAIEEPVSLSIASDDGVAVPGTIVQTAPDEWKVTTEPAAAGTRMPTSVLPPSRFEQLRAAVAQVPLQQWLLFMWLLGFGATFAAMLRGLWRLRKLVNSAQAPGDARWQGTTRVIAHNLKLVRIPRVMFADIPVPMTCGAWHPVVLVPFSADTWTQEKREVVLAHELAHIRRGDWLIQIVSRFACSLHWFNPLMWFAANRMTIERERACDEAVIALGTRPSVYAQHLLDVARHASGARLPAVGLTMARESQLEGRLMAILGKKQRLQRGALLIPVLIAAVAIPVAAADLTRQRIVVPRAPKAPAAVTFIAPRANGVTAIPVGRGVRVTPATPLTPLTPMTPVTPMAFLAPTYLAMGDEQWNVDSDDNYTKFRTRIDDDVDMFVEIDGEVEFSEDGSAIEHMAKDARLEIEAEEGRRDYSLEITVDDNNDFVYRWRVDGRDAEFDDKAKAWLDTALPIVARKVQLARLYGEYNSMLGEINSVYGDRNELLGEINELHGSRNEILGQINALHGERNTFLNEAARARALADNRVVILDYAEREELTDEIADLKSERRELKRKRRRLSEDSSNEAEVKRLGEDIDRIDDKIKAAKDELNALEDDETYSVYTVPGSDVYSIDDYADLTSTFDASEFRRYEQMVDEMDIDVRLRELQEQLEAMDIEGQARALADQIEALATDQRVRDLERQVNDKDFRNETRQLERDIRRMYRDFSRATSDLSE